MSIDILMDKEYSQDFYNCLHFAADAWELLTGDRRLHGVDHKNFRVGKISALFRGMRRVNGPTEVPSLCLMDDLFEDVHVGVCFRRKLLHLMKEGPMYMHMDAFLPRFRRIRYYV